MIKEKIKRRDVKCFQGHTRHVKVWVTPISHEGDLPFVVDSILGVQIGCVIQRNKSQAPMDSFQDDDLTKLRDRWADALVRRKQYLEEQLKLISQNSGVFFISSNARNSMLC